MRDYPLPLAGMNRDSFHHEEKSKLPLPLFDRGKQNWCDEHASALRKSEEAEREKKE